MDLCLSHKLFIGWNLLKWSDHKYPSWNYFVNFYFEDSCILPPMEGGKPQIAKDIWGMYLQPKWHLATKLKKKMSQVWFNFYCKISFKTKCEAFLQS